MFTLVILIAGLSVAHAFLASPEILYNENDPFMYALRRQAGRWLMPSSAEGHAGEKTPPAAGNTN